MAAIGKIVSKLSGAIPRIVEKSKPKLNTFVYYAKVEMIPPTPAEFPQVAKGFGNLIKGFKTSSWRNLTVKEAWLNTLITVEVMCWFFVGEIIGKRKLVGYDV